MFKNFRMFLILASNRKHKISIPPLLKITFWVSLKSEQKIRSTNLFQVIKDTNHKI